MSAGYPCLVCGTPTRGLYCDQHRTPQRESRDTPCGSDKPVTTRSENPADRARLERDEIATGLLLLGSLGFRSWRVGQYRADAGGSTPGAPDVIALKPGWGVLFWEAKRAHEGSESTAQHEFRSSCVAAAVPCVCGSAADLADYLALTIAARRAPTAEGSSND